MPSMLGRLDAFHRHILRQLTIRAPYVQEDTGKWVYPPFGNSLEEAVFYMISEYISRRCVALVYYVASTRLLNLCQYTPRLDGLNNQLLC
jgi:hypothetical protein